MSTTLNHSGRIYWHTITEPGFHGFPFGITGAASPRAVRHTEIPIEDAVESQHQFLYS
jgi:hypothetical protein